VAGWSAQVEHREGAADLAGRSGEGCAIAVIMPQEGPITFAADVELSEEAPFDCEMVLFAGQSGCRPTAFESTAAPRTESEKRRGRRFPGNGYTNLAAWNGAQNGQRAASQSLRIAPQPGPVVQLRCSFDPQDGTIRAWQNEQPQGKVTVRNAPKDGLYAVFVAYSPMAIRRLRVLPGVVLPGGEPEPAPIGPGRVDQRGCDHGAIGVARGRPILAPDRPRRGAVGIGTDRVHPVRPHRPPNRPRQRRPSASQGATAIHAPLLHPLRGGFAGQSDILGASPSCATACARSSSCAARCERGVLVVGLGLVLELHF